ncbi:MAG TPA: response regulator transcription factor [Acidimicrobiales bacterium]|nr:response regulator transcription factor [Acidimicrobiales bacterium]
MTLTRSGGAPTVSPAETAASPVRVLVVDDQALFRRGVVVVLSSSDGIEIVGEAGDGEEAVAKAQELEPDVVLMDVRMPRLSGIEATRHIRRLLPGTEVLMLTVSDNEDDLFESVKAGANGYLLKEVAIDEIARTVRAIVHRQAVISPSMTAKLLAEFRSLANRSSEHEEPATPGLTAREMQVLQLMAKSQSNKEIAGNLFISDNTVKNHVRNILEKLHMHSRLEAVTYAWRKHLLDPRDQD